MRKHKKKLILTCTAFVSLLIIGSVLAYYQESISIENEFESAEARVYLNEKFDPNDLWVPGEEKQKEVRFGNEGEVASVLRVKFTPMMECADYSGDMVVTDKASLNFTDNFEDEWVKNGDWYYYKNVLEPDELTGITLKSVSISDALGNDEHGIEVDYSGSSFDVCIDSELIQASLAGECALQKKWELLPEIEGKQVQWKTN